MNFYSSKGDAKTSNCMNCCVKEIFPSSLELRLRVFKQRGGKTGEPGVYLGPVTLRTDQRLTMSRYILEIFSFTLFLFITEIKFDKLYHQS